MLLGFSGIAKAALPREEQIRSLLAQIVALQQQLTQLQSQTPAPSFCYDFNYSFGMGSQWADFIALTTVLDKENISERINNPMSYDEITAGAVVIFQAKYGIRQTGYVGPLTRARLNALYGCSTPVPPIPLIAQVNQFTANGSAGPFVAVPSGSSVKLEWTSINANYCYMASTAYDANLPRGSMPPGNGSLTITPIINNTYSITCYNAIGSRQNSITINVYPVTPTQSLTIAQVSGINTVYAPGGQISFTVKGVLDNGLPASNAGGFSVQAYVCRNGDCNNYLSPNPYYSYNGNYNANSGLWEVTMNAPFDTAASYQMKITLYCSRPSNSYSTNNCNGGIAQVEKLINFNVVLPTTVQPSITVTSLNGSNTLMQGQTYNITWQSVGLPVDSDISIQLSYMLIGNSSTYESVIFPIGTNVIKNTGSYNWTIPMGSFAFHTPWSSIQSNKYLMRVIYSNPTTGQVQAQDYSDNYFSIVSQ